MTTLAGDAELLASELLSNAVKASWSADDTGLIAVRLLADRERLLIEVWDQSPGDPRPRQADFESESGQAANRCRLSWGDSQMSKVTMTYLECHWGDVYTFAFEGGKHTARAKFGQHDLLEADSPEALLSLVRRHYPGSTSADLCST